MSHCLLGADCPCGLVKSALFLFPRQASVKHICHLKASTMSSMALIDQSLNYQPTCVGALPLEAAFYSDLLEVNLWDNKPSELTNFCMGTPLWKPHDPLSYNDMNRIHLPADVPIWSPQCRCEQPTLTSVRTTLDCWVAPSLDRPALTEYCLNRCSCQDVSIRQRFSGGGVLAEGGMHNVPQDLWRKKGKSRENYQGGRQGGGGCFGSCASVTE